MRLAPAFTTCPVKPAGIFSPLRTMKNTEHPFVEGAYREVVVFQHFERSEKRRGSHSLVGPGFEALDLFVDKVTQHAGLHL